MNYNEQVHMFKDMIPIGPRSVADLVMLLRKQIELVELSLNDLPVSVSMNIAYNATHCILNDDLRLRPEDMSFIAFKLKRNEKSIGYFLNQTDGDDIYIAFEENTGYIWSNCNRLFIEQEFARGVSQYEIETEGNQFRNLVSHLAMNYCERNST
jgi:hypothetical protein